LIAPLFELVQLGLAAAAFGVIVVLVARSALAGAALVLGAFVISEATSPLILGGPIVQFGSLSIYVLDVSSLALLAVGITRLLTLDMYGPARVALATLVVLLAAHLAWGIVTFGTQSAINNSRLWLTIVSGIVYGATVRDWDSRLPTAVIATGCALAVWSIVEILRHGLYAANTFIDESGRSVDARPVISMGVLVMLEALILVVARGRFTWSIAALSGLLAAGIVLLQYRTLWVAAIAAAAMGVFYLAMRFRASSERLVYLLTAAVLIFVPALLFATSRVGTYEKSASSALGESSTLTWRVDAWRALLEKHSSPLDLVLGTPSGTDRQIVVHGLQTDLSAHNLYVEALLLYGLIGLFAICALGVLGFQARTESARQLGIAPAAIVILIACQALVAAAHQADQVQGLLLGSMISAACFQFQRRPAVRPAVVRREELELALSR
jgi:hypothetical protein